MFTSHEKHRLAGLSGTYSIYHWQSLFSFLVGRPVDLVETDEFLREESARRFGKPAWEDTWNGLQRTS